MSGLLPQTKDDRDLKMGQVFTQPTDVPKAFRLPSLLQRDQKDSDFCAAFAAASAIEPTEGVLSAEFIFAMGKLMTGDPDAFGLELRDVGRVLTIHGSPEALYAPRSLETAPHGEVRHIETWGPLEGVLRQAITHRQKSYLATKGTKDAFGNITSWIWKNRKPVVLGVWFGDLRENKYMETNGEGGHAMVALGWDGDYIICQNSYPGTPEVWVHRKQVENGVNTFGAIQFMDISPEEARYYAERGLKADENGVRRVLLQLYLRAADVLRKLIGPTNIHTGVPPYPRLITKWAEAIRLQEGWYRGSRSWRNNNPGNLKWMGQKGTTGKDEKGFAVFESVEAGWDALQRMLYNAASGKSKVYTPDMTLVQFFAKYAPSYDDNDPGHYANRVAGYMGVTTEVRISSFLTIV